MSDSSKSSPSNKGSKKLKPYKTSSQSHTVQDLQVEYEGGIQKLSHIRHGVPYQTVEALSFKAELPVKRMLEYLGMPQTTYNKKKREGQLLSARDTEVLLALYELFEYGLAVFNQDHKSFDCARLALSICLKSRIGYETATGLSNARAELTKHT